MTGDTFAVDLVHLANAIVIREGVGTDVDGSSCPFSAVVAKRLNLTEQVTELVVSNTEAEVGDLAHIFKSK